MFCTVSDVEEFLQITIPMDLRSAAESAIQRATAAIQNYCRQDIELVEDDELVLDCAGGTKVFLPELPVVSVASVVEDDETLTVSDDYKLGQHGILHRIGGYWPSGIQIIAVCYTHGHSTIPDDVVDVCMRAAARAYQAGLRASEVDGVPGVSSTGLGDYSVAFGGDSGQEGVLGASAAPILLRSERQMLNRYRI